MSVKHVHCYLNTHYVMTSHNLMNVISNVFHDINYYAEKAVKIQFVECLSVNRERETI